MNWPASFGLRPSFDSHGQESWATSLVSSDTTNIVDRSWRGMYMTLHGYHQSLLLTFLACLARSSLVGFHSSPTIDTGRVPEHQADMLRRKYKSASITSSVLDYEFENGRRYHAYKAGSYPLPNDEVRPTNSPCSAPQCRMVFSGPTLSTVPLLDPNTILTPWVWIGRAGANRHQTSCHHAPCRRAPAPRTSSQPYEDTGHWDGHGNLGNGDGGSVPRFLSDWDWSLSRPAKVVWINLSCEVMGSSQGHHLLRKPGSPTTSDSRSTT